MPVAKQLQRLSGWVCLGVACYAIWQALTVQVDVELCDLNCKNTTESFGILGGILGCIAGAALLWLGDPLRWRHQLMRGRRQWKSLCHHPQGRCLLGYLRQGLAVLLVIYAAAFVAFNAVPGGEGGCRDGYCPSGGSGVDASVFFFLIVPVLSIAAWLWWGRGLRAQADQNDVAKSRRFFLVMMARNPEAWIRPTRFAEGASVSYLAAKAYLSATAQEQQAETSLHKSGEVAYRFTLPRARSK